MTQMDENGEILLLHASKNNARPLVLPWFDDFAVVPTIDGRYVRMSQYLKFKQIGRCLNYISQKQSFFAQDQGCLLTQKRMGNADENDP